MSLTVRVETNKYIVVIPKNVLMRSDSCNESVVSRGSGFWWNRKNQH